MTAAVTYAYYRDEYGGELPVEAFTAALPAATRHLLWLTGGASIDEETQNGALTAYNRALCAAIDAFAEYGEGLQGETGPKGETGATGADGVSCTHSWNGTVLTVTSASGTSSADLVGPQGPKGETGAAGPQGPQGETGPAGASGTTFTPASPLSLSGGVLSIDLSNYATQSWVTQQINAAIADLDDISEVSF